jgi:hypothetical protein
VPESIVPESFISNIHSESSQDIISNERNISIDPIIYDSNILVNNYPSSVISNQISLKRNIMTEQIRSRGIKRPKISIEVPFPFPSPTISGDFVSLALPKLDWKDITLLLKQNYLYYRIWCGYESNSLTEKWHFSIRKKDQDKSFNVVGVVEAEVFQLCTFHYMDTVATGYLLSAICYFWLNPDAQRFVGQREPREISTIKYDPCSESDERLVKIYFTKTLKDYFKKVKADGSYRYNIIKLIN